MQMNPDIRRLWVEALRSGLYQQGQGRLTLLLPGGVVMEHCCLGVLCQLALAAGVQVDVKKIVTELGGLWSYDEKIALLPPAVWEWAGLDGEDPAVVAYFDGRTQTYSLTFLNDNGRSFDEIAERIEGDLDTLQETGI